MNQRSAVEAWWAESDGATRSRALRLKEDDLLPADMQRGLAMAGVTVSPVGVAWDGEPEGYWAPQVLWDFLQDQRRSRQSARPRSGVREG